MVETCHIQLTLSIRGEISFNQSAFRTVDSKLHNVAVDDKIYNIFIYDECSLHNGRFAIFRLIMTKLVIQRATL